MDSLDASRLRAEASLALEVLQGVRTIQAHFGSDLISIDLRQSFSRSSSLCLRQARSKKRHVRLLNQSIQGGIPIKVTIVVQRMTKHRGVRS